MAQDRTNLKRKLARSTERTSRGGRIGPLNFYMLASGFALASLVTAYLYLVFFLDGFTAFLVLWDWGQRLTAWLTALIPKLDLPLALSSGWLLACLGASVLLYLWFSARKAAIAVTVVLTIIWMVGIFQYVQGTKMPESLALAFMIFKIPPRVASFLVILLLIGGVLLFPALFFLRPFTASPMILFWLLLWLVLTFGLNESKAGVMLLFSLLTSCTTFLLGLRLTSGFLLPLPGKEHRGKVLGFLRDYATRVNFPISVVVNELYEDDKLEERVSGELFNEYASGPGFVISDCDHAAAISDGIRFKGVQEPGVTFTGYADRVTQVFDLRPQLRAFHVHALTKDGIKVKVLAFTPFKIDSRGRQPSLGEHLPFNKSAAFKVVHAQRIEHEGATERKKRRWDELPPMIAERILQNLISEYNFDELYGPYQTSGPPPRRVIAQRFGQKLAEELKPLGIQLVGGGISDLEPADPQVYLKRVRDWRTQWERKITLRQAEGQAEWLRTIERARAEAQADLILNLGKQLEELSTARTKLQPEETLELLLSVLEGLTSQHPEIGQLLPRETLQALTDIRRALP